jgi:hypothetical protein
MSTPAGNDALKRFTDVLVPLVRNALQEAEAQGPKMLSYAVSLALALNDINAGRRLMPGLMLKILDNQDTEPRDNPGQSSVAGTDSTREEIIAKIDAFISVLSARLDNSKELSNVGYVAVMLGESAIAEKMIQELENIEDDSRYLSGHFCRKVAVDIALGLPDKTTARRKMRKYEADGSKGFAFKIATEIGDTATIDRWMAQVIDEGQSFQQLIEEGVLSGSDDRSLMKAALSNPELGKRVMQRFAKEDRAWCVARAGMIAATLGERTVAQRVVDACKGNTDFTRLKAGIIAAMLGDISAAEAIVKEAYTTRGLDWDGGYCENVGDILTFVAKQDVTFAENFWKMVENLEFVDAYRVRVATRILENLGSHGS